MGQSVARLVLPPLLPPGSRGEGRPVLDELVSYGDLMSRRMEDRLVAERNDHQKEEEEEEEEKEEEEVEKKKEEENEVEEKEDETEEGEGNEVGENEGEN